MGKEEKLQVYPVGEDVGQLDFNKFRPFQDNDRFWIIYYDESGESLAKEIPLKHLRCLSIVRK